MFCSVTPVTRADQVQWCK